MITDWNAALLQIWKVSNGQFTIPTLQRAVVEGNLDEVLEQAEVPVNVQRMILLKNSYAVAAEPDGFDLFHSAPKPDLTVAPVSKAKKAKAGLNLQVAL